MSFLNPLLLGGMAAIAAPILLHMIARRRVQRIHWAAMRFLQAIVQKNERRLRIEDLLLLILRCLLLILLALALARPAFHAAAGADTESQMAIVAIDNSGSMGLTDGGTSRFDHARHAAEQIIERLPPGSSVALLAFSDKVRALIGEPTPNLNLARKTADEVELTDRGSDIGPAVRQALDIYKRYPAEHRVIYLITDGQATAWKERDAIHDELAAAGAHPLLVLVGPDAQPNLGVSGLEQGSAFAPVNEPVRFAVQVTNYGLHDAENVSVSLAIDADPPGDQGAIPSIPAGETRSLSLFGKFRTAGQHAATAQLPPDHLAMDDKRTRVVQALAQLRVLLVQGIEPATPRESDVFFLRRALAPAGSADFVQTQTITPDQLATTKLEDFAAVVLANVADLPAQGTAALESFVNQGGGLLLFPGARSRLAYYNDTLAPTGLMPARFGLARGNADDRTNFFTLQAGDYTHPMVSIWQDPAAGTLATAHFYKAYALQPFPVKDAAAPITILNFADGTPAIVERDLGRGRAIVFASTANTDWNDLPVHPAFVPLMQRALGRAVERRDESLNVPVGGQFEHAVSSRTAAVTTPRNEPGRAQFTGGGETGEAVTLDFDDTDWAGLYHVAMPPDAPLIFAAQPDPAESTQTLLSDAELRNAAPGGTIVHWDGIGDLRQMLRSGSEGSEFWMWFALLALVVACAETFLAGRFSAAK